MGYKFYDRAYRTKIELGDNLELINGVIYRDHYIVKDRTLYDVQDVIFNGPATIVKWRDGSKTVVKCSEDDTYDREKGLAMAILKGQMHTDKGDGIFHKFFNKWVEEEPETSVIENLVNILTKEKKDSNEKN